MKIYIKNMACIRCQLAVRQELEKFGLHHTRIELGEVEIREDLSETEQENLSESLQTIGFELIFDKRNNLVEKIKMTIIELVHYSDNQIQTNLSEYLSEKLNHSYTYLSNLFSEEKGTTIERFYQSQKIERVKELLVYDEQNLTDIAFKLNYSSVAHLSNQFKKMTGLTPSNFKNIRIKKQIAVRSQ